MKKLIVMIYLLVLFLSSCQKEPLPDPPPPPPTCIINCDTFQPKVIWQELIGDKPAEYNSSYIFHFEDLVVYSWDFSNLKDDPIRARSIEDGELIWEWDAYFENGYGNRVADMDIEDDNLIVYSPHEMQVIGLPSGKVKWQTSVQELGGSGYPRFNHWNDMIFHIHYNSEKRPLTEVYLVTSPVEVARWDTIVRFDAPDEQNYKLGLEPPSVWVSPEGDTILLFQLEYVYIPDAREKQSDIYAYNLSADTMLWHTSDVEEFGAFTVAPIKVVNDIGIIAGTSNLYGFDLLTGAIRWIKKFDIGIFSGTTFQYFDNKIIATSNDGTYAIDPRNGNILWFNEEGGPSLSMVYFEGVIYYTNCSGYLHAVDIYTGATIWNERSPNKNEFSGANFCFEGIALDTVSRRLFVSDGYFIMALELAR